MTPQTPSGQQAVEPVLSAAETADRLEAWAREMLASTPPKTGALHLLDAVHYLRTAAPTAPSTAEGERERLEEERNRLSNHFGYGARLDGSTRERIAAIDARLAALATPPAQMKYGEKTYGEGRDEAANFIFTGLSEALGLDGFTIQDGSETWEGDVRATLMGILRDANVIDEETNERITPPAPSVPWEEQAARQCEEWAIVLTAKGSNAAKVFDRIQFNADAVKLRDHARAFRALLSKPAKGE